MQNAYSLAFDLLVHKCHRPLDITLALDSSGRTSKHDWETIIKFCKELVKSLQPVSDRGNRIALLTFDERPRVAKELSKRNGIKEIEGIIDNLRKTQLSGMTFTDEALREVSRVFDRGQGIRDAQKVLILFYDGKTADRLGKKGIVFNRGPIATLNRSGVQKFVVEFGQFIGEDDVLSVVSEPKLEHIYTLNDLPELIAEVKRAAWRLC